MSKNQKENIFCHAIIDSLIPGWIGTPWDYNGTTEDPGDGSIACGYFVTTVLRDGGLNIARIKLAQCASEQMILNLAQEKYIQRFSNIPLDVFLNRINESGFGLYLVGLDNHTGFLYNDGKEIYFINSSFVEGGVVSEIASRSSVLDYSKYRVIAHISSDEKFLDKWISDRN